MIASSGDTDPVGEQEPLSEQEPDREQSPVYHEPARSYATAVVLFAVLCAGFAVDMAVGGDPIHVWGWLLAIVLVVGVDVMAVHTARKLRSISLSRTALRVGDSVVSRADIVAIDRNVDASMAVLGRRGHEGLPKGAKGLAVRLADGSAIVVPARHPRRLAEALELTDGVPEIRPADAADLPVLAEIDRRAESLYRVAGIDLPVIPFPSDALHDAKAVFVASRPPVGYVRVDEVDGLAHIEGLAVIPGQMRTGIGSGLLEAACEWAAAHGYPAVTLITFADVPWNAPFYRERGFVPVDTLTPELAELRDWEHAVGLDEVGPRVVMRRELPAT